jgi:hypothetical protein
MGVMHTGSLMVTIRLTFILSLFFVPAVGGADEKLVIDVFDKKIELLVECVKKEEQSDDDSKSYFCTGKDSISAFSEVIVAEYDYSADSALSLKEDLSLSKNSYMLNEFKVFELLKIENSSKIRVFTSICNTNVCISIFGNYHNVVADIMKQLR